MNFRDKIKNVVGKAVYLDSRPEDKAVINNRHDICHSCPERIEITNQCRACGCFIAAKIRVKGVSCPLGKW